MIEQIVIDSAKKITSNIVTQYKAMGLKASGQFERDIEDVVATTAYGAKITILGSPHSFQMINGRSKNTDQSPDGIRRFVGWAGNTWAKEWVANKGLSISPFAVAYKIAKQGVYVPNRFNSGALLDTAVADKDLKEITDSIVGSSIEEIRSDVVNVLIRR